MNKKKIVVTLHGIRTHGLWQKNITPCLARHDLIPYHIDYGWFSVFAFFFPWSREKQVREVRQQLRGILLENKEVDRISVIAHSFGTYIALAALTKDQGEIKYDRIILTGSILPQDYDWLFLLDKKWVKAVYNERATGDWVVRLARFASSSYLGKLSRLKAGDSGREQFTQKSPCLLDKYIDGDHGEAHNGLKYQRWARFIAYPFLPDDLIKVIRSEMEQLRAFVADEVDMPIEKIRVNLFAPIDGALRIVPGAHVNMQFTPELDIAIRPGHGSSGRAFSEGTVCINVKRGNNWSSNHLTVEELQKIHPSLQWVLSFPIRSEYRNKIVGVVNIDGLEDLPTVFENINSIIKCKALMMALHGAMLQQFVHILDTAFRGDKLDEDL
jgi:pimeloyl-ACP methyl ester carboxylesterase